MMAYSTRTAVLTLLGLGTALFLLIACQEGGDPVAAGATTAASPSDAGPGGAAPGSSGAYVVPLRISRGFFEKAVQARLKVTTAEGVVITDLGCPVTFREGLPEGPGPGPGAIADFRDRPGYATLNCANNGAEPLGLQFTVTPDISSLDVTGAKVKAMGLNALIEAWLKSQSPAPPGCGSSVRQVSFGEASRSATSLAVSFRALTAETGVSCAHDPIQIAFQFTQN